jgi:hypothetical protein
MIASIFLILVFSLNCARPANDALAHAALATAMPTRPPGDSDAENTSVFNGILSGEFF